MRNPDRLAAMTGRLRTEGTDHMLAAARAVGVRRFMLESLSPEQRASFLLCEVIDHPYDQLAAIVATSEQNACQLVARAQRRVEQRQPRFEPSRARRERLARRFFAAAQGVTSVHSSSCWPTT